MTSSSFMCFLQPHPLCNMQTFTPCQKAVVQTLRYPHPPPLFVIQPLFLSPSTLLVIHCVGDCIHMYHPKQISPLALGCVPYLIISLTDSPKIIKLVCSSEGCFMIRVKMRNADPRSGSADKNKVTQMVQRIIYFNIFLIFEILRENLFHQNCTTLLIIYLKLQ